MAFGVDAVTGKSEATNSTTIGWTHTTGTGANKLVVAAGCGNATVGNRNVSGITFNGVALTQIKEQDGSNWTHSELWRLNSPAIGAFTITITFGGASTQRGGGSISFIDADTTDGTSYSNTGTSANPSITGIAANSGIVVATLMTDSQTGNTEPADGTYTEIFDAEDIESDTDFHAMYKSSATTMAWSSSGSGSVWSAVAVIINPAAGGNISISSGLGALTLTGFAPTVTQQLNISSGLGALTISGLAPTATQQLNISSGLGALVIAGLAPTVAVTQNVFITTDLGALTISGLAPQLGNSPSIESGLGALVLTGLAPSLSQTAHISIAADLGQLTLSGLAPSVTQQLNIASGLGALTIDGFAPSVQVNTGAEILTGLAELFLEGFAPTVEGGEGLSRQTGAGKAKKRRRFTVEVDGQVFDVRSEDEALSLLERVKEQAQAIAKLAVDRASRAEKRPVRKILQDARKTLELPTIQVSQDISEPAQVIRSEIDEIYRTALQTIEIAALLRRRDEEDEEDILLLLL